MKLKMNRMKLKNGGKNQTKRLNSVHRANKYKYDFPEHETMGSFCESIYADKITTDEVEEDQTIY